MSLEAFAVRLARLEAENARLKQEIALLTGGDGVLARVITHIRVLQGQDEAVRREIISLLNETELEDGSILGEEELLTRARHTLVTEGTEDVPPPEEAAEAKVEQGTN